MTLLSNEDFADGLYHLAVAIDALTEGHGDPGCGVDYRNDVFEMWGFWAHSECDLCNPWGDESETPEEHECSYREWHFHHYASGLKVKWYKRIGRSTESNVAGSAVGWYRILIECFESVEKGV